MRGDEVAGTQQLGVLVFFLFLGPTFPKKVPSRSAIYYESYVWYMYAFFVCLCQGSHCHGEVLL